MEDAPDREEALNQLDLDEMDELEVRVPAEHGCVAGTDVTCLPFPALTGGWRVRRLPNTG
jgi:hypothetical protein